MLMTLWCKSMWGLVSELQIWQTQATCYGFVFHIKQLRRSNILWDACGGKCLLVDEVEARMDRVGCLLFCHHQALKRRKCEFPTPSTFYKRSERRKRGRGMSWNQRRWQWRQQESRCSGFTVSAQQTLSVARRRSSYSSRADNGRNTSPVWCSALAAGRVNNMLIQVLLNINVNGCGGCWLTGSCLWSNPPSTFFNATWPVSVLPF